MLKANTARPPERIHGALSTGGTALGQGARVQAGATDSVALGRGSVATEGDTVSVGSAGSERRITNVADGINDSDAATVGQLTAFQGDIGGLEDRISGVEDRVSGLDDRRVDKLSERTDKIGAISAAFSAVEPNPRAVGNSQLSVGIGHYNGTVAVAAGYSYSFNKHPSVNAKAAIATGGNVEHAQGVGLTLSW
jgi:autotransporter adhesin